MELRPYQAAAIQAITDDWSHGIRNVLAVLATGAGKTNVFLWLLCAPETGVLEHGGRGLVLAHRQDLIQQPYDRLLQILPAWRHRVGLVMGEHDMVHQQLVIGSVQTLMRPHRLNWLLAYGAFDYLVIDEAHRATSVGYKQVIAQLRKRNPQMRHLGVTATPIKRGDGLWSVYQHCSVKVTIRDLIPQYLVPPRWLAIATAASVDSVSVRNGDFEARSLASVFEHPQTADLMVQSWLQYARDRKTIAFTASVHGAYQLAARFRAHGISAIAADGSVDKDRRRVILDGFRRGRYQVVCNAMMWTEGLDVPEISCVMMGRPTRSDADYVQMMGRGLRPAPGKTDCLILDFAPRSNRNIVMAGDVLGLNRRETHRPTLAKPGQVIAGATYDGHVHPLGANPMELVVRPLGYLRD